MKVSRLTVSVFAILAITSLSSAKLRYGSKKRRLKKCHFAHVVKCISPFKQFTAGENGTGIVTSEQEFEEFCHKSVLKLVPQCLRAFTKRCGSRLHRELAETFIIGPFARSMSRFCDMNGEMKKTFLEHSDCLKWRVKLSPSYRQNCVRDIQAGFEYMHDLMYRTQDVGIAFESFCCTYNRWENCITRHLNESCGTGSTKGIVDLIQHGTMLYVEQLCPIATFDPDSERCQRVLPPKAMKPKGAKSKSYLSFAFSYWCPNVGYGIVD